MTGVTLDHLTPECVGHWKTTGSGKDKSLYCDRCEISHPATPDNRTAAIDENYAGIYLRRLTSEGAARLEVERSRERAA